MAGKPALVIAGHGVGNSLQLTVESQRAIAQCNAVYVLSAGDALKSYHKTLRLPLTDLSPRLAEAPATEAYLDIAGFILREAELDPPVAFLVPGNPLFLNSITRFLVQAARERTIEIDLFPGVSLLDALISDLGLDVTSRGLQVFDARHVLTTGAVVNSRVPLLVLQVGGLQALEAASTDPAADAGAGLTGLLLRHYPADHPASLIDGSTGRGSFQHRTVDLEALAVEMRQATIATSLFLDVVRKAP